MYILLLCLHPLLLTRFPYLSAKVRYKFTSSIQHFLFLSKQKDCSFLNSLFLRLVLGHSHFTNILTQLLSISHCSFSLSYQSPLPVYSLNASVLGAPVYNFFNVHSSIYSFYLTGTYNQGIAMNSRDVETNKIN